MGILVTLLVGALAGYLANHFMARDKDSVVMNLVLGIGGAFLGNLVLSLLGTNINGWFGDLLSATGGAVLLIYLVRWVRKR